MQRTIFISLSLLGLAGMVYFGKSFIVEFRKNKQLKNEK